MFSAIAAIAEQRIAEAIENGTLNIEGWKNKPLPLSDDSFVPEDMKMAYKIMKNSGYLPPEVEIRKEVNNLEDLIAKTEDEHVRLRQIKKLNLLLMKLDSQRSCPASIANDDAYYQKIVENITTRSNSPETSGRKQA